jgi:hypothetical protein
LFFSSEVVFWVRWRRKGGREGFSSKVDEREGKRSKK